MTETLTGQVNSHNRHHIGKLGCSERLKMDDKLEGGADPDIRALPPFKMLLLEKGDRRHWR